MITMISCALIAFTSVLQHIPFICTFTLKSEAIFGAGKNFVLTFYQIRRLQNSLSVKSLGEVKYKQYGLSNAIFVVLYAFGIAILLIGPTLHITLSDPVVNVPNLGCIWSDAEADPSASAEMVFAVNILCYYAWDLTVLSIYIVKFVQIRKEVDKMQPVYRKAKAMLLKIIILTLCFEASAFIFLVMVIRIGDEFAFTFSFYGAVITLLFNVVIPFFTIYLMTERHQDTYLKLVQLMKTICCCGRRKERRALDSLSLQTDAEIENNQKVNASNTSSVKIIDSVISSAKSEPTELKETFANMIDNGLTGTYTVHHCLPCVMFRQSVFVN